MNVAAYLERIHYHGALAATAETLCGLQLAHLLAVPFENLSIHAKQPIVLDQAALLDKIVARRRGGFCYEVNGAFAALLRALGFRVTLLSASVAGADGSYGPPFDHLALLVELEQRWLVDVGFGDSFRAPLLLDTRAEQWQGQQAYRIDSAGDELWLMRRAEQNDSITWEPQYHFTLQPYQLADYATMCQYHQTSPDSHFTQRRICSLATADGRITLSELLLIITTHGTRREQTLPTEQAYLDTLREQFGITV